MSGNHCSPAMTENLRAAAELGSLARSLSNFTRFPGKQKSEEIRMKAAQLLQQVRAEMDRLESERYRLRIERKPQKRYKPAAVPVGDCARCSNTGISNKSKLGSYCRGCFYGDALRAKRLEQDRATILGTQSNYLEAK